MKSPQRPKTVPEVVTWESEGASCIRRNRVPAVRTAAVANEPTDRGERIGQDGTDRRLSAPVLQFLQFFFLYCLRL